MIAARRASRDVLAELRMLHALTIALERCESLSTALAIVVREVCKTTGWELGETWIPSSDGLRLESGPRWHAASPRLKAFAEESQRRTFKKGEGLPGRVWTSGDPAWVPDVREDQNFPRRFVARRVGIKAGFAIPVLSSGEVIAILSFFVFERRKEDRRLIELVSAVAAQLGEIIQRRVAEESLKRSRYELEAEARERQRIARELHDGVTQILSSTLFRLRCLKPRDEEEEEKTRQAALLLEQAVKEVRRISVNLNPGILEELGLCAAIRALGDDLQSRTGHRIRVSCRLPRLEIPPEISWTVYRILQEGLQNIEKHSQATEARLALGWKSGEIRVSLRDNGKGFSPRKGPPTRGWKSTLGLGNMKERAQQVGGRLDLRSSPGQGTRLSLTIPWLPEAATAP